MNAKKLVTWVICFVLLFGLTQLALPRTAIAAADSDFQIAGGKLWKYTGNGGKVVIPDGVTIIGDEAFANQPKVSSLIFPEGLKVIGTSAFSNTGIKSIELPDGLEEIGDKAFDRCRKLTKITFPQSLQRIGKSAFRSTSVSTISLPSGLEQIESTAFIFSLKLKEFQVDSNNADFTSRDGVLYTKDMETLVLYPPAKKGGSYSAPEGVKRIGAWAFCSAKQLGTVLLPAGLETIGEEAFIDSRIKSFYLPASTKELGEGTFEYCISLKEVGVDGENQYFTAIDGVLYTKDMKTLLAYPAGSKIKEFKLPEGVSSIGAYAFSNSNLTYVFMKNGSLKNIGKSAFEFCTKMAYPVIPEGVDQIFDLAFEGCGGMKSIQFPSTLKYIGEGAFENCSNLNQIDSGFYNFPDGLESIGSYAFIDTKIKNIIIPKSVMQIGDSAFDEDIELAVYKDTYGHQYAQESGYSFGIIVE
jgi:hypothetical protein